MNGYSKATFTRYLNDILIPDLKRDGFAATALDFETAVYFMHHDDDELVIPYPDNPQHVDNLATIELLEAQGFEGPDASLAESLFEYHIAWRDLGDEILIIYPNPHFARMSGGSSPGKQRYDRVTLRKNIDPMREWDWVNWEDVGGTHDWPEDWKTKLELTDIVQALLAYYGSENIFGGSYWDGFTISEDTIKSGD